MALAVAAEMAGDVRDGVAWVELAPLRDPALVPAEVAGALGVRERSEQSLVDVLKRSLVGSSSSITVSMSCQRCRLSANYWRRVPISPCWQRAVPVSGCAVSVSCR